MSRSLILFSLCVSLVLVTSQADSAAADEVADEVMDAPAAPAPADGAPGVALEATPDRAHAYSFGVRVGGYGFRNPEGDRRNAWNDCRMNGMGAFGQRRFGDHAFVEAGADFYFSESFPFEPAPGEWEDRMSGLFTVAGGMRMFPRATVSPYVQLGAGLELTRIAVRAGDAVVTDGFALPMAFVGLGGDLRVHPRLRLGMNLRAQVMGHFDHDPMISILPAGGEPFVTLEAEPEAVAQMQFYAHYEL